MKNLIITALVMIVVVGCAPKQGVQEYARTVFAVDAAVDVNSHRMTVSWKKSGTGMIAGYNIYISEQPLAAKYPAAEAQPKFKPFNEEPFPGDTNPEDGIENFVAENLKDGVKYYVSVRVVYPDKSVSKPSNEVMAVCGPRGTIDLAVRYAGGPDGFSFMENDYVAADAADNDLYFFSGNGSDVLNSPDKLNGFLRKNRLLLLPFKGDVEKVSRELATTPMTATDQSEEIKEGDWVLIQTPEKTNALVQVLGFTGEPGANRQVKLYYAYSALVGEAIF